MVVVVAAEEAAFVAPLELVLVVSRVRRARALVVVLLLPACQAPVLLLLALLLLALLLLVLLLPMLLRAAPEPARTACGTGARTAWRSRACGA